MLKTLMHHRMYALTALLFAITFVICGIAWLRFFTAAATNPSPVHYMAFDIEGQTRDPFQQTCVGPSFIEPDAVWRYCQYTDPRAVPTGTPIQWGLVRFDLVAGVAALRWPLAAAPDAQILALAPSPTGDLAIAWGTPKLSAINLIDRTGGSQSLSLPPDADHVAGLAWTGTGTLELVTPITPEELAIFAFSDNPAPGDWTQSRTLVLPTCAEDDVCAFQAARYDTTSGWQAVTASASSPVSDLAAAAITFTLGDEAQHTQVIGSAVLADLDPAQYTLDDGGQLVRLGTLFDRAPGNVVNWHMDAAPFVLDETGAGQLSAPDAAASFYFSNYEISGDHLRWIPGVRYPRFAWHMGDWMTLRAEKNSVVLAHFDGRAGDPLTANVSFLKQGAQSCVLPASKGGYWVLGPHGAYLKADDSMARADSLTVIERIERTFANFSRFDSVSDDFYREQRAFKMAAFPLVLLSLPVGYLLVFFVRQARKNTRAWLILLLQISAIYLIVATVFFWWFWELMGDF